MVIKRTNEEMYRFNHKMFIKVMILVEDMLNNPRIKLEVKDPYLARMDVMKTEIEKFMGIPHIPFTAKDKDA